MDLITHLNGRAKWLELNLNVPDCKCERASSGMLLPSSPGNSPLSRWLSAGLAQCAVTTCGQCKGQGRAVGRMAAVDDCSVDECMPLQARVQATKDVQLCAGTHLLF